MSKKIVIAGCNVSIKASCGLCGNQLESNIPVDFATEQGAFVCRECVLKHEPLMAKIWDLIYKTPDGRATLENWWQLSQD